MPRVVTVIVGMTMALLAGAASAEAARVLKVGPDGKAHARHDALLPPARETALPRRDGVSHAQGDRGGGPRLAADHDGAGRVRRRDEVGPDRPGRHARRRRARRAQRRARQRRGAHASGQLTSSRLAATLTIVRRNKQFWPVNPVPAVGTRIVFTGSPVYLEYYRGEGLQIQPLANFGKANAPWSACKADGTDLLKLRNLLDAMLEFAAQRGTFTTWEYYFDFEGGVPPWTSGMSQATALQALSRAYKLTGDARYRDAAARAIPAFETAPPVGVAVPATGGTHFLMYSYAPSCSSSTACCRR